jgi:hypothetical protein
MLRRCTAAAQHFPESGADRLRRGVAQSAAAYRPGMAKEPTDSIRLARSLHRRIARIAAHKDQTVPDYLAERLGPIVDADEAAMLNDIANEKATREQPEE